MSIKRKALGKGLSALIPDAPPLAAAAPAEIDIDLLRPNPYQPREHPDDARLEDLARSIKANGVIQPILVRHTALGYQIVAGERRWRAAQMAGILRVPMVIRDVPDEKLLEVALIENIQREELNPIEEASAYARLVGEFHLSQDEIANAVGKDRSTVANIMRLLKLPPEVRTEVASGRLSMGHARALLGLPSAEAQRSAGREVVTRGLSVRETEALVRRLLQPVPRRAASQSQRDVFTRAAEDKLRTALGTRVRIIRRGTRGAIEIEFVSEAELQRLYDKLTG